MSDRTAIEWADATLNPLRGCSRVSPGCQNCYAERVAARFSGPGQPYEGLATIVNGRPRWTGQVQLVPEKLDQARRWQKPRRIFLNSMSDLFHEAVPKAFIDRTMAALRATPQHTYIVLTKRPDAAAAYFFNDWLTLHEQPPPRNLWLGVSVESAAYLDRITTLQAIPRLTVRFISFEPLLGPIHMPDLSGIHWIIIGGESGPGARPMHPDWARELVSQGKLQGCAVFFKQWGAYSPANLLPFATFEKHAVAVSPEGIIRDRHEPMGEGAAILVKLGKHQTGRTLDGREWNEFPDQAATP